MPIASAGVTDYIKLEQNAFTFNKTTIACVTGGIVSARIVLAEEQRSRVESGKETLWNFTRLRCMPRNWRPRTKTIQPATRYRSKGQPRRTRNEFPIRADFGNSRNHPIWRPKRGEVVLSPEKCDFTVLLTNFTTWHTACYYTLLSEGLFLPARDSWTKIMLRQKWQNIKDVTL